MDYPQVTELWKRSRLGPSVGDDLKGIKNKVKRDPELFLVAEEKGLIVGSVLGGFDGRRGWIYHLGILPGHRRKGLGRKLVQELELRMKKKGVPKVNALVFDWNSTSLAFFKEMGYYRDDRLVHHSKILVGPRRLRRH